MEYQEFIDKYSNKFKDDSIKEFVATNNEFRKDLSKLLERNQEKVKELLHRKIKR